MKGKHLLFLVFFYFTTAPSTSAQLFVDTSYTAEQMVMDFFDNNFVTISNVTFQGSDVSMGYFEAANTNLGIPAGILLSSGDVHGAIGPNNASGFSTNLFLDGSSILDSLLSLNGGFGQSYDAAVLEMDLVSSVDTLDFSYVFGSEEYLEFVFSEFNDIFAFMVSGPNIPTPVNIALIPGQQEVVSINTVNNQLNSMYYQDSTPNLEDDFQYDGFTTELPAPFVVIPNETYHIEIAIADVADNIFDSGVFLGIESLMGESNLTPPAIIDFEQAGSVVNFDNLSRYATSYLWDFGDNTTSTERYPGEHFYTSIGDYTVTLITQNYCCTDTVSVNISVDQITNTEDLIVKPYQLFPNPVSDHFQIKWPTRTNYTATIFDSAGRVLWSVEQVDDLTKNIADFETGIYWLQLKTAEEVFTERIVKQ